MTDLQAALAEALVGAWYIRSDTPTPEELAARILAHPAMEAWIRDSADRAARWEEEAQRQAARNADLARKAAAWDVVKPALLAWRAEMGNPFTWEEPLLDAITAALSAASPEEEQ